MGKIHVYRMQPSSDSGRKFNFPFTAPLVFYPTSGPMLIMEYGDSLIDVLHVVHKSEIDDIQWYLFTKDLLTVGSIISLSSVDGQVISIRNDQVSQMIRIMKKGRGNELRIKNAINCLQDADHF